MVVGECVSASGEEISAACQGDGGRARVMSWMERGIPGSEGEERPWT